MPKTVEEMTAQVLKNLKTGYQCMDYPMPGSNFTKEAMDASKAAGVGKEPRPFTQGRGTLRGRVK